jgi:hypothetical protein
LARVLLLASLAIVLSVCSDDSANVLAPGTLRVDGDHSLALGETLTLRATTEGAADSAYGWSSSRNDVVSVDGAGVATGLAVGEAIVTATGMDSGLTAEHVLVVTETAAPGDPFVSVSGTPFVEVGATVVLSATTGNGDDASYAWSSSDIVVATVADDGSVTGNSAGQVTITATGSDSGASGSLTVVVANEIPYYDEWLGSAHADVTAEAFNHWNEDDPAEIPTSCAHCHSTPGYQDYLGADGSAPLETNAAAPIGTVIECQACHNTAASELDAVPFPSGETVDRLGAEARCMVCHQGRSSKDDVDEAIVAAGVVNDDETSANLHFQNIHYYAAAATLNAGRVRGGYQYDDEIYDWRFRHVPGYDTCIGCHNPHSLEVKVDECGQCHTGVSALDDLRDVRMMASLGQDYDGDGDLAEGMYYELQGLKTLLLEAISAYTIDEALGAICHDDLTYPYWFKDTNENGMCDGTELDYANQFAPFTARLLKATYNYQLAEKDPGAFAHNSKYIIQLLYDGVVDLNQALMAPIEFDSAVRNDVGHFNGASEAARHWDEDDEVSASCSRCHGGSEGLHFFLTYGAPTPVVEPDNGLDCATCHSSFGPDWNIHDVNKVTYPGGVIISEPDALSNICANCHTGRESKKTIDDAIAAGSLSFRNVHYLPAAGVRKGTLAKLGYEYPAKTYAGQPVSHGACVDCHAPVATNHSFSPFDNVACTAGCHQAMGPVTIPNFRTEAHTGVDFDGDGNATEPLAAEIETLAQKLLERMSAVSGTPALCYTPDSHPYFFKDTNGNTVCDTAEVSSSNRFTAWNAGLMKAAHNFQIAQKEHGAWAHNLNYMIQLLFDSIEDLGGDVTDYIRP